MLARLESSAKLVVSRRDGERDGGVHPIDPAQAGQVPEDEVALGDHLDRKTEFGKLLSERCVMSANELADEFSLLVCPTVYVVENQTLKPRQVEIGLDNSRMVHILDGLKPGELVSLTAPLHATAVKPSTDIIYLNEIPELEELKGNETFSSDESSTDRQTDLAIKKKKKKKKKKF